MKHVNDSCLWNVNMFMKYIKKNVFSKRNLYFFCFCILPGIYIYRYIKEDFKVKSIIRCVSPSPCFQAIIQFGICQLSRLFYWKRIWAQVNHEPKGWKGIRYTFGLSERFSYNLIHKCNATPILFMLRLETIQTESNPLQAIFTKDKILHGS